MTQENQNAGAVDSALKTKTLAELIANTRKLEELHHQKIECIKKLTYHAALKVYGVDHKNVARLVRERVCRHRTIRDGEVVITTEDCIDWRTGNVRHSLANRGIETGRIAGVVLNDDTVVRFSEPIDGWTSTSNT